MHAAAVPAFVCSCQPGTGERCDLRAVRFIVARFGFFGDWSREFGTPDGTLFAATERKTGLWRMQELKVANRPSGRLDHRILGFGQDPEGEVYVGATLNLGPSGTTGKVFKLVRPSGK